MMGHGSPRLQDGQGQSESHSGDEEGQRSTEGQGSDLDSQTRRLVAQVQASLEEGQRLVPTTVVPTTTTTVTPGVLDAPGVPAMHPQEYQIFTAEQAPPPAPADTASSSYGGQSKAQSDRVNKHSGHTVTQAQTRSDEQASKYHYGQQQQQQYLQQQQLDLSPQHVVHDYSTRGRNAPVSSSVPLQHTVCPSQQQQQHRDMDTSEGHQHQVGRMGHGVPYSHQAQGKPWTYQQEHVPVGRTEWNDQSGGFQPNESRMQGRKVESGRQYQAHMPPKNGQTTEPQMSSLLQRRISRTEFVHMYSSDDRYPSASAPHPQPAVPTSASQSVASPRDPESLPEKVDSPISYVSEWLRTSTVWGGEGGYGTPTTADMERDSSQFVYPPPSKLLTDSTPRQHHEEVCISHQEDDSNVIRSFLHEQQEEMKEQQKAAGGIQLAQERHEAGHGKLTPIIDCSKSQHIQSACTHGQFIQEEISQQERMASTQHGHYVEQFSSDCGQAPVSQISKQEQAILVTPQITLDRCEPMVTQLETSGGSPPTITGDSDTQQLPVRNLKISSPKSTRDARRASSPVVSKPAVPFFWHFNPRQGPASKSQMLSVKEQTWRRYSDSNIPMEPEDLRIKPAIRSKSTGDSTSYEDECLSSQKQADSNLLSVAACKTAAAHGASRDQQQQQQQAPDDKSIITKRLKLKTYLQNRYEADKEEEPTTESPVTELERMRMSTNTPELHTESRMSVSQTSGSHRSLSLQSPSERKVVTSHPGGSLDEGLLRGAALRQRDSPEKTHLTRAIQSWRLPHPITIKVEPVSPFPSEDDPETPGSVFTPGINVPATPTSFFSPGVPSTSGGPRQVFSFNVPTCREMSPPNQRAPRRVLAPMYQRHEKSASLSALAEKSLPPPPSPSHISLPTTHHDQRHHSDTVIYTEHKPLIMREDLNKPKEQPVDMRRSPPGGRRQPPPPLQLAAGMSAFSQMEDQPMPSPSPRMLPPPPGAQQPHISEFLAASAPPAGLRSPAFPFSTLPAHLHSHSGSSGYPILSPGPMTWSAPPSAALLPQQSPRHPPASVPSVVGATGGTDTHHHMGGTPQRMMRAGAIPHQQHSQQSPPQIVHPQHQTGRKGQQNLSKYTLTNMAAIQQLREQQLREGTLLRDPNLTYMCPVCGQLFPSYNYLANHMVNHLPSETVIKGPGENKSHLCKVCNRAFSRSDMLTRHMRLHTGLKPYECRVCGQVFSRSDHLHTHQRTHTGEKPYKCPKCPYAAPRRDMITRHMRIHTKQFSRRGRRPTASLALPDTRKESNSSQDSGVDQQRRNASLSSTDSFESEQSPLPRTSLTSSDSDLSLKPRHWSMTSLESLESSDSHSVSSPRHHSASSARLSSTTSGEYSDSALSPLKGRRSWSTLSSELDAAMLSPLRHDSRSMSLASIESAETDVTHLSTATSQGSNSPDMRRSFERCTVASDQSSVSDKTLSASPPEEAVSPREGSTPSSKSDGSNKSEASSNVETVV